MEHCESHEPLHPDLPHSSRTVVTLAALPLIVEGRVLGGVAVAWEQPVCLTVPLRDGLEQRATALAEQLAGRDARLERAILLRSYSGRR